MILATLLLLPALSIDALPSLHEVLGSTHFLQTQSVDSLALEPERGWLASTAAGGELAIWEASSGKRLGSLELGIQRAVGLEFFGQDRLLVGSTADHLLLVDLDEQGQAQLGDPFAAGLGDLTDLGGGLALSPGADRLAIWRISGVGGGVMLAELGKPAQEEGARRQLALDGFRADSVSWSPDGRLLAVMGTNAKKVIGRAGTEAEDSSRVFVFEAATGALRVTLRSSDDLLQDIGFGPLEGAAGGLFVAGGAAGLHLWDLTDGRELSRFGELEGVRQLALTDAGQRVYVLGAGERIEAWRLSLEEAPSPLSTHDLGGAVESFLVEPTGHLDASQGRRIRRWSLEDWRLEPAVEGHASQLAVVAAQAGRVASVGLDGSVLIWDLGSQQPRALATEHRGIVLAAGLSPDGRRLVTGGQDATLRVFDVAPGEDFGKQRALWSSRGAAAFTAAAYSPLGETLAGVSADGVLWIRDATTGELLRTIDGLPGLRFQLAFSPDGKRLAAAGAGLQVWDTSTWELVLDLESFGSPVTALGFDLDGQALAVGLASRVVERVDLDAGEVTSRSEPLPSRVSALAFIPGGLAVTSARLGGVRILNATLESIGQLTGSLGLDATVLAAGDGLLFVGDARGLVGVWACAPAPLGH